MATLTQPYATPSRPVAMRLLHLTSYRKRTYSLQPFSAPKSATNRFTQMLPNLAACGRGILKKVASARDEAGTSNQPVILILVSLGSGGGKRG